MTHDAYEKGARFYDGAYSEDNPDDVAFYVDLAAAAGSPVLELGCGTGRVALPIARRGITITGLDSSGAMLSVLRGKLEAEPDEVRRRVELVQGDMRSERLGREFSLVIIPFRPMQHMYSVEDQLGALTTAREHLADGGLFAFDVFFPMLSRVEGGIGEEYLDSEWPAADGSGRVHRRYFRKDAYDPVDLNFRGVFLHRLCAGDEVLEEEEQPLRMSVYTYPHLKLLFAAAGLEIVEQYGTFDRQPLDADAREMIFVLKRR